MCSVSLLASFGVVAFTKTGVFEVPIYVVDVDRAFILQVLVLLMQAWLKYTCYRVYRF